MSSSCESSPIRDFTNLTQSPEQFRGHREKTVGSPSSIMENIDLCVTLLGPQKPPALPLRQELLSEGVECVLGAKGVCNSAVTQEQNRREIELLEKLDSLELKLKKKRYFKQSRRRKKGLMILKELRSELENSASGISYSLYLEEIARLHIESQRREEVADMVESELATMFENLGGDRSLNTSLDTSLDFTLEESSNNDDTTTVSTVQTKGSNSTDHDKASTQLQDTIRTESDHVFKAKSYGCPEEDTNIVLDHYDGDSVSDGNSEDRDNELNLSMSKHTMEESPSFSEGTWGTNSSRFSADTMIVSNITIDKFSSKVKVEIGNENDCNKTIGGLESVAEDATIVSCSSASVVRFKGVKPSTEDNLSRAKALLANARELQRSYSGSSLGSSGSFTSNAIPENSYIDENNTYPNIVPSFIPEKDRYHLFVNAACPWSHRAVLVRSLKGLQDVISMSYISCTFRPRPFWDYSSICDVDEDVSCWFASTDDSENHNHEIDPIFASFKANYSSIQEEESFTVPILWDKHTNSVISNNSVEIMRIFNFEFNKFSKQPSLNLYPSGKKRQNDEVNEWLHHDLNIAIYRCGFSTTQEQYDDAIADVTEALDRAEAIIGKKGFLTSNVMTESDIRLFSFLLRFDEIYRLLFKTNTRRISTMPALMNYVRDIYQIQEVGEVCDLEAMKKEYYKAFSEKEEFLIPQGIFLEQIKKL